MDEQMQDLIDMMLGERFSLAHADMTKESKADAKMLADLVVMNKQILTHPGISKDAQALVQQFIEVDMETNEHFQEYLYRQGAKDCVIILRELGLIR